MINEDLASIQVSLKAPKNLYNNFGKYKYRNAEGICEAVKPYLVQVNCSLTLSDEIVAIADRIYVKATATLANAEGESVSVTAYAREAYEKKGMDDSQITGTASSYARKYALNGLFLLDDTKDADTDEYAMQTNKEAQEQAREEERYAQQAQEKISEIKVKALVEKCKNDGLDVTKLCELYKVDKFANLTEAQLYNINKNWKKILEKVNGV